MFNVFLNKYSNANFDSTIAFTFSCWVYASSHTEYHLVYLISSLSCLEGGKLQIFPKVVLSTFHCGLSSLRFDTHLCCCTKDCETGDKFMGKEEIQVEEPLKAACGHGSNGFLLSVPIF